MPLEPQHYSSLDALLSHIDDPAERELARKRVYAETLDRMFAGCEWLDETPDLFRKTPDGVIADIDRVMGSLSSHSAAAGHIDLMLHELRRRRSRGFGLVWDAESPDNAERLRIPIKDESNEFGLVLDDGAIVDHVDSATNLYRIAGSEGFGENIRYVLQPWEPRTGDLPSAAVKVAREEISHIVQLPYDKTTKAYPVPIHRETIAHRDCPPDAPVHTIIEGENYHALQALQATHRGKIDLIYIDPPYNTGKQDFAYNDRYVSTEDDFRHSSWLRFMQRRLQLAKELLSPAGVLIVAIGDDEHHQLRLLLDQTMGANNFISDVVWQGGRKGATYVSASADYMLLFARDKKVLDSQKRPWRERKSGIDEVLSMARELFLSSGGDVAKATPSFRKWLRSLDRSAVPPAVTRYSTLEAGTGRPYRPDGDASAPDSPDTRCHTPLIHPVTLKPCPVPAKGWRWTEEELYRRVAVGQIVFGRDESTVPSVKRYLDEVESSTPSSVFERDRTAASNQLQAMLGNTGFANPKDVNVLARWFKLSAPADATILDFFAGSGSTLQAVAQLNEADGGKRRCIVVTNNTAAAGKKFVPDGGPDGICQRVTIPRTRAVLETGYAKIAPILQRCEVFKLDYLHGVSLADADVNAVLAAMPMVWRASGLTGLPPAGFDPVKPYVHPDWSFAVLPPDAAPGDLTKMLAGELPGSVWVIGDETGSAARFLLASGVASGSIRHLTRSYKTLIDNLSEVNT